MCPRKKTTEPKLLILVSFFSEVTSYTDISYCILILWEVSCSVFSGPPCIILQQFHLVHLSHFCDIWLNWIRYRNLQSIKKLEFKNKSCNKWWLGNPQRRWVSKKEETLCVVKNDRNDKNNEKLCMQMWQIPPRHASWRIATWTTTIWPTTHFV